MSSTVEALQNTVRDEGLQLAAREESAQIYVAMLLAEIPEPAEDNPDVIAAMTEPHYEDGTVGDMCRVAWRYMITKRGWAESGPTLEQARVAVHSGQRWCALLAVCVDTSEDRLTRLQACKCVLEKLDPQNNYRKNGYTPEKMLDKVLPANGTKWTSKGEEPVVRPPESFMDVWEV